MHQGNSITLNRNGSVGYGHYQEQPFCSNEDVHVFTPIGFDLNVHLAMFFIALFEKERYRYNYGRKWGLERMRESIVRLPVKADSNPDFEYMEQLIKSLPYSSST